MPEPQRVHAVARRSPARAGVAARRRLRDRLTPARASTTASASPSAADAVVVTVNYRLGSLGWLASPGAGLGARDARRQLGAARPDRGAALGPRQHRGVRWRPRPGHARRAVGRRAVGAMDLLVAPARRRAVSPRDRSVAAARPTPRAAGEASVRWGAGAAARPPAVPGRSTPTRCAAPRTPSGSWRCTRSCSTQSRVPRDRGGALPTVDPGSLPALDRSSVPGPAPSVDVLIGLTAQEGTFFFRSPWRPAPPAERIPGIVAHLCPTDDPPTCWTSAHARARDRAGTRHDPLSLLVDIATDAMVAGRCRRGRVARARRRRRGAASTATASTIRAPEPSFGATHTVEVPLLFGTWDDGGRGRATRRAGARGAEVVAASWSRRGRLRA